MMSARKKDDPTMAAQVRAAAEKILTNDPNRISVQKKRPTLFQVPLESIKDGGISLELSMTGSHLCIKV